MVTQPINLTLEELATEVAHLLEYYSLLGAAPDSRVSAVPDGRTIRYYTTLGILDRPTMDGRQARYGKRQVLQLLAIKALQAQGLPLSDIQSRLYGLTNSDLESLLVSLSEGRKAPRKREREREREPVHRFAIWHEIVIEPGLKLMVADGWRSSLSNAEINEKLRSVLNALRDEEAPDESYGGDQI